MVQPFAEMSQGEYQYADDGTNGEVPVIELNMDLEKLRKPGEGPPAQPMRCQSCMGYMCRHTNFFAQGQQAVCHLCCSSQNLDVSVVGATNERGKRVDIEENP